MIHRIIVVFLLTLAFSRGMCQNNDSVTLVLPKEKSFKPAGIIVPGSFVLLGSIAMLDRDVDEFFINRYEIREERNEYIPNFSTHIDDYLQHAPSLTTFVLSLSGIEGKHNLKNQAALYVKSELLMLATVFSLKNTVGEGRPDSGNKNSFPSGHTAQAFTAASFLAKEFGHKNVWIKIGAYSAATTVGVLRVLNNRHWVSDVLVGAGIGMLSTEVVYRTHGRFKKNRKNPSNNHQLSVNSFSAYKAQGISIILKF